MVLEWTFPALDDLEHIRDHIGEDSALNARRFIERIFQAAEQLPEQPHSGRLVLVCGVFQTSNTLGNAHLEDLRTGTRPGA